MKLPTPTANGSEAAMADTLFAVEDVKLSFPDFTRKPLIGAAPRNLVLKGVSFTIAKGSVLGIVGESGSGKTTLGRALVRLATPDSGRILFEGRDIANAAETALRPLRRHLQVIFQDPMSSLNPRKTIGEIIAAPILFHGLAVNRSAARQRTAETLRLVGLSLDLAHSYPHELSGGQRQRAGIARAIALEPRFVLADEIVSGLDMSSQAVILDLLGHLREKMHLTMAFISHDLSVIRRLCDHVIVMRAGEIVEDRATAALFNEPCHPYTRELLSAIPLPEPDKNWLNA
jgi:ABC-type oligopeptide transport system ATPase subunit